ncbi:hypothetical protein [Conexibacter woesei]|uniref:Uncharacterized protein n=1 Tax=Conexibacter woesei (strain DSM 14684 / CCUG 47730 / CIP 108061 / JCM 11494 / NBRC 100937 / ID131577) TaxID=469383 RepID=D3F9T9_CONWI|nr:hypothetical protein [Conexibacter woesei]ADB51151.1 hypothetical protein Cwoe_2732 [Conexibacter woesei DSM 14684]
MRTAPRPAQLGVPLLRGGSGTPVDGRLAVVEDAEAYAVVIDEDVEDWLVRFGKDPEFPAQAWADNMARVLNARREGSGS